MLQALRMIAECTCNLCSLFKQKLKQLFLGLFFKVPELNDPGEFVASSMTCPLAMSVIVTLAPLITVLKGSLTVPTMLRCLRWSVGRPVGRNSAAQRLAAVRNPGYARVFRRQLSSGAPAYGGKPMRWTRSLNRRSEWSGSSAGYSFICQRRIPEPGVCL